MRTNNSDKIHRRGIYLFFLATLIFSFCFAIELSLLDKFSQRFNKRISNADIHKDHKFESSPKYSKWFSQISKNLDKQQLLPTVQEKDSGGNVFEEETFHFTNPQQNLRSYINSDGWSLESREGGDESWEWRYSLSGIGRVNGERISSDSVEIQKVEIDDQQVNIRRNLLTEWYKNSEEGIEQGFTIMEKTPGVGDLILEAEIDTDLKVNSFSNDKVVFGTKKGDKFILSKLIGWDSKGNFLKTAFEYCEEKSILTIRIDDSLAVYPIIIDPLASDPSWSHESNQASANLAQDLSLAGDVNGDGYADVIVGIPNYDNGEDSEGMVLVFYGSATGLNTIPDWSLESNQVSASFGWSVSGAGDVDGDGYSDVIIASPNYDIGATDNGAAFLYLGGASGLSTTPHWSVSGSIDYSSFGSKVSSVGDVNSDGFSDFAISEPQYTGGSNPREGKVHVYYGSDGLINTTSDWTAHGSGWDEYFGDSISNAGDVNGDGFSDFVVGARGYSNGETAEGAAFLFHGSSTGLSLSEDWIVEGNMAFANLGYSVSTAGDVNGDGYSDIVVGASNYANGESGEGAAFLYYGSSSGLSLSANWSVESNQVDAKMGSGVSLAGDVNGDGYSDIVIGTPMYSNGETSEGLISLFQGSASGLSTTSDWSVESNQENIRIGFSLSTAGDINNDGFSDFLVGSPYYSNGESLEGKAFLYEGSSGGLASDSDWSKQGDKVNGQYGATVSSVGDLNGDGYSDFAVSSRLPAWGYSELIVYYGSSTGVSGSSINLYPLAGIGFGESVTAGDVNGDGFSDLVVGAPYYENGESYEGAIYIFHGASSGINSTPTGIIESNYEYAEFGYSVSAEGDINGDGFSDLVVGAPWYSSNRLDFTQQYEGAAFAFYGSVDGLSDSPNWIVEGNKRLAHMGNSISMAGDVNGDGYSDVIVGVPGYNNSGYFGGVAYVYYGSEAGLSISEDWMGESLNTNASYGNSVSTAGDINGDGYSDIIIGAYTYSASTSSSSEGAVYIYYGSSTGLSSSEDWLKIGDQEHGHYGNSVATAGDINGDGFSDVVIGAKNYSIGESNEGVVYLYYGSSEGLSISEGWIGEINQTGARYGWDVDTTGDVNGDGYSEIIVGAKYYTDGEDYEGGAFLYFGNGKGLSKDLKQTNLDNSVIPVLGRSDSVSSFKISAKAQSFIERSVVKMVWEVKPYGTLFDGTDLGMSSSWIDTGVEGVTITETVSGLSSDTLYHWRAKFIYKTSYLQYSTNWFSPISNGWNEADLRTLNNLTLRYTAGDNGTLSGDITQIVANGSDGTPVTAQPDSGYTFIEWSDGSTQNPRTDTNVTEDIIVSASFDDITPPSGGSVVINNGSPYTNNNIVNLDISAIDEGLGVSEMRISESSDFTDGTSTGWIAYNSVYNYALSSEDGVKAVYVQVRDSNLNESEVFTDSINLDTSEPFGSVLINNGDEYTNNLDVGLELIVAKELKPGESWEFTGGSGWLPYGVGRIDITYMTELGNDVSLRRTFKGRSSDNVVDYLVTGSSTVVSSIFGVAPSGWVSGANGDVVIENTDADETIWIYYLDVERAWFWEDGVRTLAPVVDEAIADLNKIRVSEDSTFSGVLWEDYASSTYSYTLSGGDGNKTVYFQVKDQAGNITSTEISDSIILDAVEPTGTISINGGEIYTDSATVTLDLTFADAAPVGDMDVRVAEDSTFTGISWESYSASRAFTLSSTEGAKTVYLQLRDGVGNISATEISASIILDTVEPTGTISIDGGEIYTDSATVTLDLTFADAAPVGDMDVRVSEDGTFTGASWESYTASKVFTFSTVNGTKTVYLQLRDGAGNISSGIISDDILLDSLEPANTSLIINSGEDYTNNSLVNLSINATENGSGLYQMRFGASLDLSSVSWQPYSNSASFTLSGGDGLKTVYVQLRDYALNESSVFSSSINLDSTDPIGTLTINDGDVYANSAIVNVELSFIDDTALSDMNMRVSEDQTFSSGTQTWTPYVSNFTYDLSSGDGLKTIYLQLMDGAGNVSSLEISDDILLDTVAPTGNIVINAGETYADSEEVSLYLDSEDSGSGVYHMSICDDLNFEGSTCSSWVNYSDLFSFSLTGEDGIKSVYVRFRDAAGNISETFSDEIYLDRNPPEANPVINNSEAYTNDLSVTLNLNGTDLGSGVAKMKIILNDDLSEVSWQLYRDEVSFMLQSDEGLQTVYVQLADNLGQVSGLYSDSIIVDREASKGSMLINSGNSITASSRVKISVNATDELSGVHLMRISEDRSFNQGIQEWIPYKEYYTFDLSSGDGQKNIYIQLVDKAGNISDLITDDIFLDLTAPSVDQIILNEGEEHTNGISITVVLKPIMDDVKYMKWSFNKDALESLKWEEFNDNLDIDLIGKDGLKHIYFVFKDGAGNISEVYGESIYLDREIELTILTINGQEYTDQGLIESEQRNLEITGTSDPYAMIAFAINGTEFGVVEADEYGRWSFESSYDFKTGVNLITLSAIDQAGNQESKDLKYEFLDKISKERTAGMKLIDWFNKLSNETEIDKGEAKRLRNSTSIVEVGAALWLLSFNILNLPSYIVRIVFGVLTFLGLRRRGKPYGYIYNSQTREPIEQAIVRIYNRSGKLIRTDVTDIYGVFRAELSKGDYRFVVSLTGFKFPSRSAVKGEYSGGWFKVDEEGQKEVELSIPVDPVGLEYYRNLFIKFRNSSALIVKIISPVIYLVGLISSIYLYSREASLFNLFALILYIPMLFLLIKSMMSAVKSYGRVIDSHGNAQDGFEIALIEEEYGRKVETRIIDEGGFYRFIVPGGNYLLKFLEEGVKIKGDARIHRRTNAGEPIIIKKDLIISKEEL